MAKSRRLKDPKRAAQRKRERASQDRRGLYECRFVIAREHAEILKTGARLCRQLPDFADKLRHLIEIEVQNREPSLVRCAPADAKTRKTREKAIDKAAAMRDLFDGLAKTES